MRKSTFTAAAIAVVAVGLMAFAQRPTTSAPAAAGDDAAVRAAVDAYVAAYNKGDIDTVMAYWADGSEFIGEDGTAVRGKEAVGNLFRRGLAESKGQTMRIKIESIRRPRPDLVLLDGRAEVTNPADGSVDTGPFSSVWSKVGDRWQIITVRDLPQAEDASVSPGQSELRKLDWLVGDWVYQDKDTVVTLSCKRTQSQHFYRIDQVVRVKDQEVMSLIQVIGWDPLAQQMRSWVFDSAGGFGNGWWDRNGNEWTVVVDAVRADGQEASGVNSWHYIDANTFEWSATDREIDGNPAPDLRARYTRQPVRK